MAHSASGQRLRAPTLTTRFGRSSVAARLEHEVRLTAADLADSVAEARLRVAAARYKVEDEVRSTAGKLKSRVRKAADEAKARFGDDARFLKSWIDSPAAPAPSRHRARSWPDAWPPMSIRSLRARSSRSAPAQGRSPRR